MRDLKEERGVIPTVPALIGGAVSLAATAVVFAYQTGVAIGESGSDSTSTILLGAITAALSALSALVGWMVRRIMSGDFVRVDIAKLEQKLAEATRAIDEGHKREDTLRQFIIDRAKG